MSRCPLDERVAGLKSENHVSDDAVLVVQLLGYIIQIMGTLTLRNCFGPDAAGVTDRVFHGGIAVVIGEAVGNEDDLGGVGANIALQGGKDLGLGDRDIICPQIVPCIVEGFGLGPEYYWRGSARRWHIRPRLSGRRGWSVDRLPAVPAKRHP